MGSSVSGGSLAQRMHRLPASLLLCVTWSTSDHNSAVFIIHKAKYSIQSYPRSRTDAALCKPTNPSSLFSEVPSSLQMFPNSPPASMAASHGTTGCLSRSLVQILRQEGWPDTPQLQSPVPQTPSPSEPNSIFYRTASPTQIGCLHTASAPSGSPANGGSQNSDPPLQRSLSPHTLKVAWLSYVTASVQESAGTVKTGSVTTSVWGRG